jgi:hypothetical protein
VANEVLLSLNASIRDCADLLTVEAGPLLALNPREEGGDGLWINEVDEGVAHIALVLEVNGEVNEVVLPFVSLVDEIKEHILGVLVWDVPDHQRGALIYPVLDVVKINLKALWNLVWVMLRVHTMMRGSSSSRSSRSRRVGARTMMGTRVCA